MASNFDFPQRLCCFPSQATKEWELDETLYARLELEKAEPIPSEVARIDLKTAIFQVKENIEHAFQNNNRAAPVYRLINHGTLCVSTGLIFVVWNEGDGMEECSEQISACLLYTSPSPRD